MQPTAYYVNGVSPTDEPGATHFDLWFNPFPLFHVNVLTCGLISLVRFHAWESLLFIGLVPLPTPQVFTPGVLCVV